MLEPGIRSTRRGDRTLCEIQYPADGLERPHELEEEGCEEDELADGDLTIDGSQPSHGEHERDRDTRDGGEPRQVDGGDPGLLDDQAAHARGSFGEGCDGLILSAEGLHHGHADDPLVRCLGHVCECLLEAL